MQFGNINWKQCRFTTKNRSKILKVVWNKKNYIGNIQLKFETKNHNLETVKLGWKQNVLVKKNRLDWKHKA